jgi:hypothetical protein
MEVQDRRNHICGGMGDCISLVFGTFGNAEVETGIGADGSDKGAPEGRRILRQLQAQSVLLLFRTSGSLWMAKTAFPAESQ